MIPPLLPISVSALTHIALQQHTEAVAFSLEMQVSIPLCHDAWTLQAQKQRPEADNMMPIIRRRVVIRLRYYARFLVDILEDEPVVLESLLACVFEHFAHVLCSHS